MIHAAVDRFEGNKAVLLFGEEEISVAVPKKFLPPNLKEGDYLDIDIAYNEEMTRRARHEAESLLAQVKAKNK